MAMSLPAPTGKDFTPPPEGTHPARCYRVIDLGTQQVDWKGTTKYQHKIILSWELPEEIMQGDDPRPFTAHQRYTFSTSEKAHFRAHLESWRGKRFEESDFGPGGFDVKNLLGVPCLLTIIHNTNNSNTYANIKGVAKVPKGMTVAPLTNETVFVALTRDDFNAEAFEGLSDGLKETIRKSPEYQEIVNGVAPSDPNDGYEPGPDLDDEIPF